MTSDQIHVLGQDIGRLFARLQVLEDKVMLARKDSVFRLIRAMTLHESETGAHLQRVGLQAEALARALEQDEEFCKQISIAAMLHDIGKIAVPSAILTKPGTLTDEERDMVKLHTRFGAQLLKPDDFDPVFQMAAEIALNHHEWYNGQGYPGGLKGENIPLSARIVAVIDVADSMGESRAYRAPLSAEHIEQHLRSQRGLQFDPAVLDAYFEVRERSRRQEA